MFAAAWHYTSAMQQRPYLFLALPAIVLAGLSALLPAQGAVALLAAAVFWLALAVCMVAVWAPPAQLSVASTPTWPMARLLASAGVLLANGLLVLVLIVPAWLWWQRAPSLTASLGLASAAAAVLLLPWRLWPALVLPVLDRGEGLDTAGQTLVRLRRALRAAQALTGRQDLYFRHGLPVLLLHSALLLLPLILIAAGLDWPLRASALALASLLAALGYAGLQQRVRALLDAAQAPAEAGVAPVSEEDEPIPQRPLLRDAALRTALREGRVERALVLLAAGASATAAALPDEVDQRDALTIAATLNDSRPLRAMIAAGASIEHRCQGLTPLLAACRDSYYGRAEIVLALIANGADLAVTDEAGRTPLHHAALSTEPAVAAMLLDASAAIDGIDDDGHTPLARACAAGNLALVRLFLERKAALAPKGAVPALCAAAAGPEDDPAIVQRLLRARADVRALDEDGRSALHHAVLAGHETIVQCLLDAGIEVDLQDRHGQRALDLVERGAGAEGLRQRLIAGGAATGPAILQPAGEAEDIEALLRLPLPKPRPAGLLTGGTPALRQWLLTATSAQRCDLALEASIQGAHAAVSVILARPLPADARLSDGRLLIEAALDAWPATTRLLLALPACGVAVSGGAWLARLLSSTGGQAEQRETIALAWLDAGADQFAADPNGIDPLHHAVAQGLERLAVRLLERGVDSQRRDFAGYTPLHRALDHDDERARRLVIALLRCGADPRALASSGETPLGLAMNGDRGDLVDWLRWSGWSLPPRRLQAHDVAAAARAGDLSAVRRLLGLGLDSRGRDGQACPALVHAAGAGHLAVVTELIDHGADLDAGTAAGVTPLVAAIIGGRDEVVEALLERGARARSESGRSNPPLLVAAACGRAGIVERLLRAGANARVVDAAGNNALHAAAGHAFGSDDGTTVRGLLMALLASGAEVEACNEAGLTPLHIACGAAATVAAEAAGVDAALDVLLSRSRDADRPDGNGCTPLHYAAANGQLAAVRRLLKRGADSNRRDQGGWRAEDYATRYGFTDVVQELRSPRPPGALPLRPA